MPRILIFNGAPEAAQRRIGAEGGRSNETLIMAALDHHTPVHRPVDYFALNVADGETLPQGMQLSDFDGVWISGSPLNVYHSDQPAVRTQIDLAREIWHAGIPTFGSCWGLQLMVAALGGTVRLNPKGREIGVARRIALTDAGRGHAMYRDRAVMFEALCTHEDEVATLPSCGVLLASNGVSRVQSAIMTEGRKSFWGVQYHPEFGFGQIAAIITMRAERHIREGFARSRADVARLVEDFATLDVDPGRTDLAWTYGLGPDTLDLGQRTLEFRNWLEAKVMPFAEARAAVRVTA